LPKDHIASLAKLYSIDKSDNAEIKLRFYQIALKSGPDYAEEAAGEWIVLASFCLACSFRTGASGEW